jgi:hypothetical protein
MRTVLRDGLYCCRVGWEMRLGLEPFSEEYVASKVIRGTAEFSKGLTKTTGKFWESLWAQDDQCHSKDDEKFGKSDIKH